MILMCLFDCLNEPSLALYDLIEKKKFTCDVANGHITNGYKICSIMGLFIYLFILVINTNDFFNGYNFFFLHKSS
jgi:hypothetical protein